MRVTQKWTLRAEVPETLVPLTRVPETLVPLTLVPRHLCQGTGFN